MLRSLFLLTAVFLFTTGIATAKTLYVSKAGDGSTGADWTGAYPTINQALTASASGDQIWVASGTYNEHVPLVEGVALYGGFAGTEATDEASLRDPLKNHSTIVSTKRSKPVFRGFTNTILDGFTITSYNNTGGVSVDECYMTIANCVITQNSAGGIGIRNSTVELTNCQILNNQSGGGAGAYIESSSVSFGRCVFSGNVSSSGGGGLSVLYSKIEMLNCLLTNNEADYGGGISVPIESEVELIGCTFDGNTSHLWDPQFSLVTGQAIYQGDPPGGFDPHTSVKCTNCIVWDSWGPKNKFSVEYVFNNSDVLGLFYVQNDTIKHTGSFDLDPQFVDPEMGKYRLKSYSPCIDSGTETTLTDDLDGNPRPVDVAGRGEVSAYDMGCYEFQLKPADMNSDGMVNGEDLLIFQEEWMRERE
ncbi:MAG: right-handed parallel beta-helix repeat-containing protein [Candidatus Omnitrophica bacterium]|nr:right-handed parallel beta-helix repeat-containing protein [Candidatus Omnitrophota bacterium]